MPQVEVTFDIDANGIVNVSAKDRATSKEQKITITGSSGLSKAEVDRMVREAESHASEDRSRRDAIEARNEGEALAYQVEKTVREHRDRLPAVDVQEAERALGALRAAITDDDLDAIRRATADLQKASQALAERLHAAKGAPGAGPSSDVVDAEVVG
jgi:molecular chaperone DnaK